MVEEIKLCKKGLHPMTDNNILLRKAGGFLLSDGTRHYYTAACCKICHNIRMAQYMKQYRIDKPWKVKRRISMA